MVDWMSHIDKSRMTGTSIQCCTFEVCPPFLLGHPGESVTPTVRFCGKYSISWHIVPRLVEMAIASDWLLRC
jgi:hypothetical protein